MQFRVLEKDSGKLLFLMLAPSRETALSNAQNEMKLHDRREQEIMVEVDPAPVASPRLERFGVEHANHWFDSEPWGKQG